MKTILSFLLTKTKLLRLAAFALVGWLISAGVIKEADKSQVGEAAAIVLVGAASLLIERKKDGDAAALQTVVGAKPDGWTGPKTLDKVVEVRRAIPVYRSSNPAK